jgi:hypothetical protein
MYLLTDFQSYQDYFEAIANSHIDIEGFMFGDEDIAINKGRAWKGKQLWLEPWQPVKIVDQLSDNYLQEKTGTLWLGGSPPSAKFQDRLDYYGACEAIVKDIIARMLKDRNEELLITRITTYRYGMGEFTFSSTPMVGCRFDFTFHDPSGFEYNENKWQ